MHDVEEAVFVRPYLLNFWPAAGDHPQTSGYLDFKEEGRGVDHIENNRDIRHGNARASRN
jgi:hypothetical protein